MPFDSLPVSKMLPSYGNIFTLDIKLKSTLFSEAECHELSGPGGSHPQALAETDVNLSAHPAPIDQPLVSRRTANVRKDPVSDMQSVLTSGTLFVDVSAISCISLWPT